jgi:hypothetical protein
MGSGIGGHQRTYKGRTNEWFTPKWIIDKLGYFDLDPCSSDVRPFDIAPRWFTKEDNGLSKEWTGIVFVNPPYVPETKLWLKKLKEYKNGIALVFAGLKPKCSLTMFGMIVLQSCLSKREFPLPIAQGMRGRVLMVVLPS